MFKLEREFDSLKQLLENFHIKIKNLNLYFQAFAHPSFAKSKNKKYTRENNYNDLEFLGDSILQFLSSNFIYRKYSELDAGKMTLLRSKLVCTKSLNQMSNSLHIKRFIKTGPGLMHKEVIKSNKVGADVFEALIAALYLDHNLKVVNKFLETTLFLNIDEILKTEALKDAKTIFQEHIQSFSKNSVNYVTISIENNLFEAKAYVENHLYGIGQGKNKTLAEENAAQDALNKLKI